MWFEKYKHDIPVIHLNGKFLMKHKVFTGALEEAIKIALTRNNKERYLFLKVCNCLMKFLIRGVPELQLAGKSS